MTVMTVKGRGYFCHLNLTLKNYVFLQELNFANQKTFFSRENRISGITEISLEFNLANLENANFSQEFNFANLKNSNFSREFNFAKSRLIR